MPGGRPRTNGQPESVKSVVKVLDILEHLGSVRGAVALSDLARATGVNVSTAFRLLQTLMSRGYVEQDRNNRGYMMGPRMFQMGTAYLQGSDLADIGRPHLEALRDAVGETAYLVTFSQGEIIQLCKADGKQAVSAAIRSMVREPAYCTATGKVLLSALAEPEFEKYVESVEMEAFTPQTITSKAALRREIAEVRAKGFAVDGEEFVPNLCCLAVPVQGGNGAGPVAAVSIAMPKMRFKKAAVAGWCDQLREKASLITSQVVLLET
ncbi:MAG: IclR family transcriptional regulator [Reyranella sp.]|nr:MAG: IclR family transcriptional regulator [Reyranella sp.]